MEKAIKALLRATERFEHVLVIILLLMLMFVVFLGTVGLLVMIVSTLNERFHSLDLSETSFTMPLLHEVFTGFLMILIGLELMKTIVMYLDKHMVHVEVVMSVAMIAIARHVIDMNLSTAPPLSLIGTGVIIFALASGFYYFKKAGALAAKNEGEEIPLPKSEVL